MCAQAAYPDTQGQATDAAPADQQQTQSNERADGTGEDLRTRLVPVQLATLIVGGLFLLFLSIVIIGGSLFGLTGLWQENLTYEQASNTFIILCGCGVFTALVGIGFIGEGAA